MIYKWLNLKKKIYQASSRKKKERKSSVTDKNMYSTLDTTFQVILQSKNKKKNISHNNIACCEFTHRNGEANPISACCSATFSEPQCYYCFEFWGRLINFLLLIPAV